MSELNKVVLGRWLLICAIPSGWFGYINSGATHIGGMIVGGICGMFIGSSLLAIFIPKVYLAFLKGKDEDHSMLVSSPFGSVLVVVVFILVGFFLRFLINPRAWLGIIAVAIATAVVAIVRLAITAQKGGMYVYIGKQTQSSLSNDNSSFDSGKCGSCGEKTESVSGEESRSYGKSMGHYTMEYSCERCLKCNWESERSYSGGYWDHT